MKILLKYCNEVRNNHEKTQKIIHEEFSAKISTKDIPCKCNVSCGLQIKPSGLDLH